MATTFDPKKYTYRGPRPLPVILLLDCSTSMEASCYGTNISRIEALNKAVRDMLDEFSAHCTKDSAITVAALAYNSDVKTLRLDGESIFSLASRSRWNDLTPDGCTCMGLALKAAKALVEDTRLLPSSAYRPLVILLSDGEPNDEWEGPMDDFCTSKRGQKCERLAIMIGDERNTYPLERFVEGTGNPVLRAKTANQISRFFKLVTMTVTQRFTSQNPNAAPVISQEKAEAFMAKTTPAKGGFSDAEDDDDEMGDFYI